MKKTNAKAIGELLNDFFDSNNPLREQIQIMRVQRAWGELLGPSIMQYTSTIYVRNRVLYVSLTSSVLRNELILSRERLIQSLNKHVGAQVIDNIVIR
ncbi:MAG: DUF721 domain-containing protein [Bacteroidales bacterium]|jgi:predicted nucleic acid-binding Zn ribbon protein|nr:DUF721 domain-containing protein [Bacteroidales bacterium]